MLPAPGRQPTPRPRAPIVDRYFLVFAGLLLAGSVLAWYEIFWVAYQDLASGRGSVNLVAAQTEVRDKRLRLVEMQQHADQVQGITEADRQRLAIALPSGPDEPELLVQLEALFREAGVALKKMSISPGGTTAAVGTDQATSLPPTVPEGAEASFSVADYGMLKSTLQMVSQNLRLFEVSQLSYDPTTGAVTMTLTTRRLP